MTDEPEPPTPPAASADRQISVREAAEILRIGDAAVRHLILDGTFKSAGYFGAPGSPRTLSEQEVLAEAKRRQEILDQGGTGKPGKPYTRPARTAPRPETPGDPDGA